VEKEGEDTLLALLDGKSLEKIPNLIYRQKGLIKVNFNVGICDVNQLPPQIIRILIYMNIFFQSQFYYYRLQGIVHGINVFFAVHV